MAISREFSSAAESQIALKFLKDSPDYEASKPYYVSGPLPQHLETSRTNIQYEILGHNRLHNLRGYEDRLSLDRHGFKIINVPSDTVSLDIRGSQKQQYIKTMTEYARNVLGASYALCYDCRFRSSISLEHSNMHKAIGTSEEPDTPAEAAHVDLTRESAARRARRHLTAEEAEKYLNDQWRLRVVNIWKPFDTVNDYDLLYCDPSTVQPTDLVAVDRVSTEYIGEVYMLKPRKYYDWYWVSHQKPNEASLFVSYDSRPRSGTSFCPHTSAKNPCVTDSIKPRESVELRIIAFSSNEYEFC